MFHQTGLFGPMLPGLFGIVAPGTTSPQSPGASAQQAFQVISSNISGEHSDEAAYALAYARAVLERLGNSSAVRSIFGLQLLDVQARMRAVEANPFDQAAANALVNSVGLIGSNLHLLGYWERSSAPGVTAGDFLWSDFLAAVKSGAIGGVGGGSVGAAPKVPGIFGSGLSGFFNVKPVRRAAGGAIGADTVPAMLTPGEYVLQPRAVESVSRLFGGGFLRALNAMRLPRDFFAGLRDFAPPPRPLAFAGGGPVPGPLAPQHFANGGAVRGRAAPTININITAQTVDEAEVRRSILPAIERIMRRSR
jgi:hypothetical protein